MNLRQLFRVVPLVVISLRTFGVGAEIEGQVSLPKAHSAPVKAHHYDVVVSGGVIATSPQLAVVYLEGDFPRPVAPPTVQLVQKDLTFVPSLLPIQTGTRVEFPNHDEVYHNIFSFSPTKRFDLGRYRPEDRPIPSQIFDKPGLVTLRCEIHNHMRGIVLVLDTPHFVVTDEAGHFRLTGLPAGHYTLKAWVDSATTRAQTVDLAPDAGVRVDFP